MACERWNDDWVARLYGELDPDEARAADEHLAACDDCSRTLARLGATRRLLGECDLPVPHAPRLVVLAPRRAPLGVWSFAAGAACALLAFGIGLYAAPRIGPQPAAEIPGEAQAALASVSQEIDRLHGLQSAVEERLASLESRPATLPAEELRRLERRFADERARDLEAVFRSMTAAERRTGSFMSETREALQVLALRQDPRFRER